MTSLARQLADHDRWEWRGGMHYRFNGRRYRLNGRRYLYTGCSSIGGMGAGCVPDLDSPATKGWLLAMLRESTGYDGAVSSRRWLQTPPSEREEWELVVETEGGDLEFMAPTEGEALASALLAAWGADD